VLELRKLSRPITRKALKDDYGTGTSQGFCYATKALVDGLPLDEMEVVY